jgi:hypothetical protein
VSTFVRITVPHIEEAVCNLKERKVYGSQKLAVGNGIERPDIQIDTSQLVEAPAFNQGGVAVDDLAEFHGVFVACLHSHKLVGRLQFLLHDADKTLVVRTKHPDVSVVIPRNKPFVSHRTQ